MNSFGAGQWGLHSASSDMPVIVHSWFDLSPGNHHNVHLYMKSSCTRLHNFQAQFIYLWWSSFMIETLCPLWCSFKIKEMVPVFHISLKSISLFFPVILFFSFVFSWVLQQSNPKINLVCDLHMISQVQLFYWES